MNSSPKVPFKELKPHIANAIKESCYKIDARIYNIANEVHNISTFSIEPGAELAEGLTKIIDKTIKNAVDLDCDLSVVIKGILIGSFRASPFIREEAHKTIRILIKGILQPVFKNNGSIKQSMDGILTAIVIIAREFKLNMQEAIVIAREDILASAKEINPKFADDIKEVLSQQDNLS